MPTLSATSEEEVVATPALQLVANRPILCHVLEEMYRAGVVEVELPIAMAENSAMRACLDAEGPAGLDVHYVPYEPGKGEPEQALERARHLVGDAPCIVHVADGLLAQPLRPLVAPPAVDSADLVLFVAQSAGDPKSVGLVTRRLLRLADAAPIGKDQELAGVYLYGPGALQRSDETGWWPGIELDPISTVERLIERGGRLRVESVQGWCRYTGDAADLLEVNRLALDALMPSQPADGAYDADSRIEGCVSIHPTARVESSIIVGPAIVGPGALVLDSYLGPYTSIGADVHIEGAEIERSIILPGASIMHVGGRLVASIVGRDARVFRDFSLPRALRLHVGDGGEVALC